MTSILTFRDIDNVLSIKNNIYKYADSIYPSEQEIKDTTESSMSASYLDNLLNRAIKGKLITQLYDKLLHRQRPIYVAIYHHHLHMVCISHNLFDTLEHVLHNKISCCCKRY